MTAGTSEPGVSDQSTRRLLRSSTTMALGTVVSQVTGFLRTAVILYALGSRLLGDAYNIANTTPNIVYELLLGGILTSVVVPLLVRAAKQDGDGGEAYAQRLLTIVVVVVGLCTVVAVIFAPAIIGAYGQRLDAGQRAVAVTFARYFLPQIVFYAVGATIGAILNSRGRFAAPMWTPVLNNLVVIATGALFLAVTSGRPTPDTITAGEQILLGVGTTGGIVLQTIALLPSLRATGFRFRPRFDWRHSGLGHAGRLAGWVLVYVIANQVGLFVVVYLAGWAGRLAQADAVGYGAGYTPYANAFQLFRLPHAIVAVSLITALLPRMSAHAADRRFDRVRGDLSTGLRLTAVAIVPATAAFLALGPQLSTLLFAHGHTTVADARFIGIELAAFALGLVPFSAFQLHLRAFYALHDTRTPALINIGATAANVAADFALFAVLPVRWKVVGLAVGFAVSYVVALSLSSRALGVRLHGLDGGRVIRAYVRLAVASILGGLVAAALAFVVHLSLGSGVTAAAVACIAGLAGGGAVFAGAAARMRIGEVREVLETLPLRRRRTA